jgi:YYY domain-containing protein
VVQGPPLVFTLILIFVGLALTFSVEFVYLKDIFNSRMNTVFKFYYQAWVLMGTASAYGVYWLLSSNQVGRGTGSRVARGFWGVGFVVLLALSLVYPALAPYSKAGGFAGQPTLDGTAHLARYRKADYDAIQWLRANVGGAPTIAEAPGPQYSEYARVSTHTGLPTLLGWGGHELQWRGNYDEPGRREPDIEALYRGSDWRQARTLVEKYDVGYVYVGQLERDKYQLSPPMTRKFEQFMDLVYEKDGVRIYRRR